MWGNRYVSHLTFPYIRTLPPIEVLDITRTHFRKIVLSEWNLCHTGHVNVSNQLLKCSDIHHSPGSAEIYITYKSGSKEGGLTAQVSCKAKMQCLLRLFTCQPDYMAIKCHLCGGQIALHTRTCVCCQLLGPGQWNSGHPIFSCCSLCHEPFTLPLHAPMQCN